MVAASVLLVVCWSLALRLEIRGDFIELLPTDSAAALRYRSALERMTSSGSSIIVVARSPDARKNQRFVDGLETELASTHPEMLASMEHGPGRLRDYLSRYHWWFIDSADLERLSCELKAAAARALPGYAELEDPCLDLGTSELKAELAAQQGKQRDVVPAIRAYAERKSHEHNRFPTGYYSSLTGETYVLVLRSTRSGLGDDAGGALLEAVEKASHRVAKRLGATDLEIGLTGEIPNAIAERRALEEDLGIVSLSAVSLILITLFGFFAVHHGKPTPLQPVLQRHLSWSAFRGDDTWSQDRVGHGADETTPLRRTSWEAPVAADEPARLHFVWRRGLGALACIGLVVAVGCGVAFAAAELFFGHLNAATTFLGSIIVGNGINYSIVYLARYRDRRLAGWDLEAALLDAARVCRRGTWLASVAAGGAYGALMITSFKGFSEFGLIGAVGMVSCWLSTFVLCPALVAWAERRGSFGIWPRQLLTAVDPPEAGVSRRSALPVVVLSLATVLTLGCAVVLPSYFRDPWEYDFGKLSSRANESQADGPARWSKVVDAVLGSRGAPQLVLTEHPSEVPAMVTRLQGAAGASRLIRRIETLSTYLGGDEAELAKKERLLTLIRTRIDRLGSLVTTGQSQALQELRPPDELRAPTPNDLPRGLMHRFTERDGTIGTQVYLQLNPELSQSRGRQLLEIDRFLDQATLSDGRPAPVAARAVVFGEMIRAMRRDGPKAVALSLCVVLAACAVGMRRYRAVLVVILSLACGVAWTLGFAAWTGTKLNFLNFVAIPLTIGIGAEYAINLHDRVAAEGGSIARGLRSGGGSVLLCSITTVIGYGALLFADNRALQSFGAYAIGGEVACLTAAFFVLPALLTLLTRGAQRRVAPPHSRVTTS